MSQREGRTPSCHGQVIVSSILTPDLSLVLFISTIFSLICQMSEYVMTRQIFGADMVDVPASAETQKLWCNECLVNTVHRGLLMPDSKAKPQSTASTHSGKGAGVWSKSEKKIGHYHSLPISYPKPSSVLFFYFCLWITMIPFHALVQKSEKLNITPQSSMLSTCATWIKSYGNCIEIEIIIFPYNWFGFVYLSQHENKTPSALLCEILKMIFHVQHFLFWTEVIKSSEAISIQ